MKKLLLGLLCLPLIPLVIPLFAVLGIYAIGEAVEAIWKELKR